MKRLFALVLILLLLGGAVAYFAVPWNAVLENKITAYLKGRGINNVTFKIDRVGLHKATFDNIRIGTPLVAGGKVTAEVIAHGRHKKIRIVKFNRRKHFRKETGHRQWYTEVKITGIQA